MNEATQLAEPPGTWRPPHPLWAPTQERLGTECRDSRAQQGAAEAEEAPGAGAQEQMAEGEAGKSTQTRVPQPRGAARIGAAVGLSRGRGPWGQDTAWCTAPGILLSISSALNVGCGWGARASCPVRPRPSGHREEVILGLGL